MGREKELTRAERLLIVTAMLDIIHEEEKFPSNPNNKIVAQSVIDKVSLLQLL